MVVVITEPAELSGGDSGVPDAQRFELKVRVWLTLEREPVMRFGHWCRLYMTELCPEPR